MENRGKRPKFALVMLVALLIFGLVLSSEEVYVSQGTGKKTIALEKEVKVANLVANADQGNSKPAGKRVLQGARTSTTPVYVERYGPHFIFKNIHMLAEEQLKDALFRTFDPANPHYEQRNFGIDSIKLGNTPEWIIVELNEESNIENEHVYLTLYPEGTSNTPIYIYGSERAYQYYSSSASGTLTFSIVLAIIYMAASCCCWIFGVKQFYHLIKTAQMVYMINLLASKPKSALIYSYLEGFRYNIFKIVPNPVIISEWDGVQCQPAPVFFSEGWSCHAYNSLRNYVLGFLIYLVLFCFVKVNKFHELAYWNNLKDAFKIKMFMLTIMPDVFIAIYLNAVGGPYNSVMSLGFLFSLILILWYGYILSSYFTLWIRKDDELLNFLGHFTFSRSPLYISDSKLGLKFLAVMLEQLKVLIIVTMIGLFNNAPKTQMVIIFLVYILHAIFILYVRPWNSLPHNICIAVSDICAFILVLLIFIGDAGMHSHDSTWREDNIAAGQAVMYFLILFLNIIVFLFPVLKGSDLPEYRHKEISHSIGEDEDILSRSYQKDAKEVRSVKDDESANRMVVAKPVSPEQTKTLQRPADNAKNANLIKTDRGEEKQESMLKVSTPKGNNGQQITSPGVNTYTMPNEDHLNKTASNTAKKLPGEGSMMVEKVDQSKNIIEPTAAGDTRDEKNPLAPLETENPLVKKKIKLYGDEPKRNNLLGGRTTTGPAHPTQQGESSQADNHPVGSTEVRISRHKPEPQN
jgi:hypothetical protein